MAQDPVLRVVRGEPDDDELAALTAVVLSTLAADAATMPQAQRSAWADRSALMRRSTHPGPGAWHASALRR
jgi:hypothetical protein